MIPQLFTLFCEFANGHSFKVEHYTSAESAYDAADFHAKACNSTECRFVVYHRTEAIYTGGELGRFHSTLI